ncbi:LysR family transcriptional regulator [Sinomonas humi]|uniref:LysR family transcriptional regulator n=1 Tax=Sinomonas humi TaxID=1338436 RepID=A0A0B2AQ19_9MICC|nr:LysR family transcriptional regulator [Sinomonas humi]KHL04059.1 LysR family transcriptional regulator [Sinomonas humi]
MAERVSMEALRYAQAVAGTGSFSAAARTCGVTQPALSNGIAKLEERLGARMFERSPRGVRQTPFGQQLLPLIEQATAALDRITAEAGRLNGHGTESIRIGVSPLINPRLVAAAYNAVCAGGTSDLRPRDLVLREANMQELQDALIAGELDIILVPSVVPLPRFAHRIVDSEPVVVVGSHRSGTAPVQVADVASNPIILVPDACGLTTFTRDLFDSHELPVNTYPGEASSYRVLEQWADLGLGTALLPQSKLTVQSTVHRELIDDDHAVEIFYEAVWDPGSPLASGLAELAEQLAAIGA